VHSARTTGSYERADALHGMVVDLAERLDAEAFRRSRVLAELDLKRARECTALAKRARSLGRRFSHWKTPHVTQEQRLEDVVEFHDITHAATELGLWG
jgi:hypothetical protein